MATFEEWGSGACGCCRVVGSSNDRCDGLRDEGIGVDFCQFGLEDGEGRFVLLLILKTLARIDVDECFCCLVVSKAFAREVLLALVQEGFGGKELVDDFHLGDLICVGKVVEGHFDSAPFDGVEHIWEVRE